MYRFAFSDDYLWSHSLGLWCESLVALVVVSCEDVVLGDVLVASRCASTGVVVVWRCYVDAVVSAEDLFGSEYACIH